MANTVEIAKQYRNSNPGKEGGVVLVYEGQAYGWKDELRDPQSEKPGAFAVDTKGHIWRAVGGNNYDGAEWWKAL